jgi:hypothetical protein
MRFAVSSLARTNPSDIIVGESPIDRRGFLRRSICRNIGRHIEPNSTITTITCEELSMMMRSLLIAALLTSGSLLPVAAMAELGRLRVAQVDAAQAQELNPSKAEPMMLGPTPEEDAARYRGDFVACESLSDADRETCRSAVDEEYRPEVTNLAGSCDALEAEAKAECLRSSGPQR